MIILRTLQNIYSATIDRSKFREVASRYAVFIIPVLWLVLSENPMVNWQALWLIGFGVFIRAWGAGHLYKDQRLANGGPYLFVRHPLYLGSCILALGLIVAMHSWPVAISLGTLTLLTYVHTVRHEESNLRKRFQGSYESYAKRAGPLWPKPQGIWAVLKGLVPGTTRFSMQQYLKNREYECLLGVVAVLIIFYLGAQR